MGEITKSYLSLQPSSQTAQQSEFCGDDLLNVVADELLLS